MTTLTTRKETDKAPDARLNKPNQSLITKIEKGKLAGNGLKLHLALLFKSQQQMLSMDRIPDSDFMFEAAIVDLVHLINVDSNSDIRQSLKGYFIEMMSTVVRWESPDSNSSASNILWAGMPMLSFAEIELREGKIWARWQLPGPLLRAVADPTLYTPIDLMATAKLNSFAAVTLYQICARYRHNPSGVTSKNPPDWWLDSMISTPSVDPKTKKRVVREWRKKKSSIVLPAIQEINSKTDIEIELIEYRENLPGQGKNVTAVQFAVKRKAAAILPVVPIDMEIVRLCTKLGVPQTVVDSFSKNHSDNQVKAALYKLEARVNREDLDPVDKPVTYFSKIMRDSDPKPGTEKPKVDGLQMLTPPAQEILDGSNAIESNQVQLTNVITQVKEEMQSLDFELRLSYATKAFESFKQKGLVTASISRNMSQNNWSGSLLSKMVELYAEETYGQDWKKMAVPTETS